MEAQPCRTDGSISPRLFTLGENDEEKEGILDIKLILNQNRKINIEMQNTYQDDWTERSLFYNCRMFTDGLKKGHPYGEI